MLFSKILIANRGEIACRIIRSARALGYRTVAVFSDADAQAPHVTLADESVRLGPASTALSYLNAAAVLQATRLSGAHALHPGYGFLSERAEFAQACLDAGLVFIGPPPEAMAAMGDKAQAKRRMLAAGVPCVAGYLDDDQSDARLTAEAKKMGAPLLVKAVAGGGGRGMRLVHDLADLPQALAGARREAQSAFGDDRLMLEALISQARHIEVQVFADTHGNCIHLGERDCTAQRRRQKVIEEAPSPLVTPAMRDSMGRDAVAAALAVGYQGAGTVEFIVDAQLRHYFLEMNTRLQVEHPVTECVTGLDLVAWQLRVAAGEPLPLTQAQVQFNGHAIEARLYAEDPYSEPTRFAPQSGRIAYWRPDLALHTGVRIDHGIAEGGDIAPHYDAMVAKIIAHGHDRADAIRRLTAALQDCPLLGVRNNGAFLRGLLLHPDFAAARMHTALIDEWAAQGEPLLERPQCPALAWDLAAALHWLRQGVGQRPLSVAASDLTLECLDAPTRLRLRVRNNGSTVVIEDLANPETPRNVRMTALLPDGQRAGTVRFETQGVIRSAHIAWEDDTLNLALDGQNWSFTERSAYPNIEPVSDASRVCASVAGVVTQISVAAHDEVARGQPLVCIEAMKMEMWLNAGADGRVRALHVKCGEQVRAGALLLELDMETAHPPLKE